MIDVRLICNSSSICSDKRVGVLSLQEDGQVREGRCGNNTAQIMGLYFIDIVAGMQVFQQCVTGDPFCQGYLAHCRHVMSTMSNNISVSLHQPVFSITSASLSLRSPGPSLFRLPCLYYVPICVMHEACLRVKNKR